MEDRRWRMEADDGLTPALTPGGEGEMARGEPGAGTDREVGPPWVRAGAHTLTYQRDVLTARRSRVPDAAG
jgi:hypothetical protein